VKIVIDGAVDLPLPRGGVASVPAHIFKDGQPWSGDVAGFWSALREDALGWSTAPPAAAELAAVYQGEELVLAVHVSAELSATVEHARGAAEQTDAVVSVVDSRSLSVGAGLVVTGVHDSAVDLAEASHAAANVVARVHTYVLVERVDYLLRSGRFGLLQGEHLKPKQHYLLGVKGHAIPFGHSRSRDRAFSSLLDHVRRTAPHGVERWALSHGSARDVEELTSRASQVVGSEPDFVVALDPTVGIHVGPDAIVFAAVAAGPGKQ
jgi:DegV family protein with EDD domain